MIERGNASDSSQTEHLDAAVKPAFSWPEGKRAAISLSFDDARLSQIDAGMALFAHYRVRATFYVCLENVEQRLGGWRNAVARGHEIGNHTVNHPCSGNLPEFREKALENYTLDQMRIELIEANQHIARLLGVIPETFAYPCGQKYVGRGPKTKSYVPLVAEMFKAGRGWLDEYVNDPSFCNLSQLMGIAMDELGVTEIEHWLEIVAAESQWAVFVGHEIGESGSHTTRVSTLERLLEYATSTESRMWIAPIGTVASYILQQRHQSNVTEQLPGARRSNGTIPNT